MINLKKLKVGDVIIRFGQVYKVFKIEKETLFYQRYFDNSRQSASILSLPQSAIDKTKIRLPIEKKALDELLGAGLKDLKVDLTTSLNAIKSILNTDEPTEVMRILKMLTLMRDEHGKLPFSKREIFDTLEKRFTSEVAFVYQVDEKKAKEIIEAALAKVTE